MSRAVIEILVLFPELSYPNHHFVSLFQNHFVTISLAAYVCLWFTSEVLVLPFNCLII